MSKKGYYSASDLNKLLPAETALKFKIVNTQKRTSTVMVHAIFGRVDFKTLSIARATQLLKQKAPFIEEKKKREGS